MRTTLSRYIYAAVVLTALLLIGLAFHLEKIELKDLGTGLLAMLGTLLGATLAFRLNEDKEQKKEQAARKAAINRALFVLARQHNAISLVAREMAPFKTPIDRAFNFPAAKVPPYNDLVHHFDDLAFLIDTADVNLLMRLTVEQERFQQVLESLRVRNDFYVNELQPEIARHSLNGKAFGATATIETVLGERLFQTAMNSAEFVRSHVEASMQSIPAMHKELFAVAKRLYPDAKFVGFQSEA